MDTSSNNFFLALTFTKYEIEESRYLFNELDVIIGEDHIITTIGLESQSLNRVFEEISKETDTIQVPYKSSPYYILYRIIDAFYNKTIKSLAVSSEKLLEIQTDIGNKGEDVIDELINEDLNKIFIKHNFLSQEDIIDDLIHHVNEFHEKHLTTYFNNLKTKLAKIVRTINVLTEKNDSLMAAYNTFLSIKSNKSVTRLTFVNSIFMPLTVIAGIGGMSERSMMTGPENRRISYPLFIILCIAIAYITYLLLQKFFMKK
ncbi:MAG: CorA family divalent cation transporter [bacterium]